jgi:GNAT superfamily N-acetyltransferase
MIIREALEVDIIKASRLWLEMIAEMRPDFTPNVAWWRKIAATSMRSGDYFMIVADDGGRVVGFLDWFIFPEPSTGKIHAIGQHMFLKPELRGSGVGRKLYEIALDKVTNRGITTIDLFCFDNEKQMWEKRGFVPLRTLLRKNLS